MEFYEVVKTRRSIRDYKPDGIPEDVLTRVLEAGRSAPSAGSPYQVSLVVIKDPMSKKKMVPLCKGQSFVAEAPVLLVICAKNVKENRGDYMGEYAMLIDGAIVADHIILAARAEGLATCWIGSFNNAGIKEFLSLPPDVNVVALTPMGYPASTELFCPPENKRTFQEMVFYEKWYGNR
ncbi:MAG TPA: nitroreductase family protein [bacterium]|nr:nitroreductase family protein [bacterium]